MADTAKQARAARPRYPFRLDLEQQRKRAKELLAAARDGDDAARQRFRRHHPEAGAVPSLADAQHVVARELGAPSWSRLKAHVLAMRAARTHRDALDADCRTLHVRCGSDIRDGLAAAGFSGSFLEWSDPLGMGPVLPGDGWLDARARFLHETFGEWVCRDPDRIAGDLRAAEEGLRTAAPNYERVVLWFEHDSYDQLVLARCLAAFAEAAPRRLEMIAVGGFPGATRFIGLGQLPPEGFRVLWPSRRPVGTAALAAGRAAWAALRSPDPTSLAMIARSGADGLPHLGPALMRHCRELPWTCDGLGLTQRLALRLAAERPRTVGRIFAELMEGAEPLPWLSDLMFRRIIDDMRRAAEPPFVGSAWDGEARDWPRERLTLTAAGRALLAGEVDWLCLGPPERWVGGVRVAPQAPGWRWDEATGSPIVR